MTPASTARGWVAARPCIAPRPVLFEQTCRDGARALANGTNAQGQEVEQENEIEVTNEIVNVVDEVVTTPVEVSVQTGVATQTSTRTK